MDGWIDRPISQNFQSVIQVPVIPIIIQLPVKYNLFNLIQNFAKFRFTTDFLMPGTVNTFRVT